MAKKRKTLKCGRCSRKFSMPAHLARHTSTIHGAKKGTAKIVRGKRGRAVVKRTVTVVGKAVRGRPAAGGAAALMAGMRKYHAEMSARRSALDAEIAAIETALAALGGAAAPKKRRGRGPGRPKGSGKVAKRKAVRPAGRKKAARKAKRRATAKKAPAKGGPRGMRAGSLKSYMVRVLKATAKPLSPKGIAAAVVKAGYKSTAKNLVRAVSNALTEMKDIKRLGYGQYKI